MFHSNLCAVAGAESAVAQEAHENGEFLRRSDEVSQVDQAGQGESRGLGRGIPQKRVVKKRKWESGSLNPRVFRYFFVLVK